jgi:CubicO group peptidase (beta-lactamase class C family)
VQWESYAPGFSAASYFDSYSMHKGLLAVAVLLAADRGFLRLDDPVGRFVPSFAGDDRSAIRVRDLLWMQSGLAIPAFAVKPGNPVLEMFVGTDLRPALAASTVSGPPAKKFELNHLNSQALLETVEAASHMRYAQFLSRYLWQPLGAADARVALDHPGGEARGVCCFINTAPNWLRLGVMLAGEGRFNGRRILSARFIRLLSAAGPLSPGYGMNVVRAEAFRGKGADAKGMAAADLYYFEGHGGQRLYVVPSRGVVVFRTGRVDYDWDDVRFANTILGGLR